MKTNMKFGIGVMLVAMLILSMAVMPAMSAESKETTDPQMPDELKQWLEETAVDEETKLWRQEQTEKWMQEHTVNVTSTKIYRYNKGNLEIEETYTGNDLKDRVGINEFKKMRKVPVDAKFMNTIPLDGETFSLYEGNERVVVTETTVVMTTQTDPYDWWNYGYEYPQYSWSKFLGAYYREDPINVVWENTYVSTVKSRILDKGDGWVDNVSESDQYVSDSINGWVLGDGVADDEERTLGGYHVRLFNVSSNGDIVGDAHHDDWVPHAADEFETAEDIVAGFFDNDMSNWWVLYDQEELDNENGDVEHEVEPFCDGEATVMWRVGIRS